MKHFDESDTQSYPAPLRLPAPSHEVAALQRQLATIKALAGETIRTLRGQLWAVRVLCVAAEAENRRLRSRLAEAEVKHDRP